jgi:hypothetical protein
MPLLTIPYTFSPNELGESSQVNSNFSACAVAVNSIASAVSSASYSVAGGTEITLQQLISGQLFIVGPTSTSFVNFNNSAFEPISASAFNVGSDQKWKYNIEDSTIGLDAVLQLRPRSFTWRKKLENDLGFIAQEVQTVIPTVVNEGSMGLTLNYNGIVSALVKAVQEQQKQIETLKEWVQALKAMMP